MRALLLVFLLAGCATVDDPERLSAMPMSKRLEIAEKAACPNGVNNYDDDQIFCD